MEAPSQFARPRLVGVAGPSELAPHVAPHLQLLEEIPALPCPEPKWRRDAISGDQLYTRFYLDRELTTILETPRGENLLGWLHSTESDVRRYTQWNRPQPRVDYLVFDLDHTEATEVPDEMFMREFLAVDSSDLLAVAEAAMTWGPLSGPPDERRMWSDPEGFVSARPPSSASYIDRTVTYNRRTGEYRVEQQDGFDTHWDLIRQRHLYDLGETLWVPDRPQGEREPAHGTLLLILPVREYASRFKVMQALMESWALRQTAEAGHSVRSTAPDLTRPWTERSLPAPASDLDALDTLVRSLNGYLSGLGPHLSLEGDESWWRPVPRLTAALFLQVHAFVSEGLPARCCANEACRKWFTRQQGRSKHGQRRTVGVMYCSSSCAKAQTQREYRRRKRS